MHRLKKTAFTIHIRMVVYPFYMYGTDGITTESNDHVSSLHKTLRIYFLYICSTASNLDVTLATYYKLTLFNKSVILEMF